MPARNCYRCGKEFRAAAADRVCSGCRKRPDPGPPSKRLTLRDRQLIDLVVQGKLNKEIAYELHLTERTVRTYMSAIFVKTDTTNRTELAVQAVRNQIEQLRSQNDDPV